MQINVHNLGKSYNYDWIFRGLEIQIKNNEAYAVTGPNGSGKSTLLQVLAGIIPETEGSHQYAIDTKLFSAEEYYRFISFSSPYMELFEELTLKEQMSFHFNLKKPLNSWTIPEMAKKLYLEDSMNKQIKNFSSGMKQRLKLGLAIFSDAEITFLDEPTANMDEQGKNWYNEQINEVLGKRILMVASNNKDEYEFCTKKIHIPDYQ